MMVWKCCQPWWRHQMETFSALLALYAGNSPVPGEFPTQRPVTRSFDVYFDLRPNGRLSKQSWGWWFETASCPLWRHRNVGEPLASLATTSNYNNILIVYFHCYVICTVLYWKLSLSLLNCCIYICQRHLFSPSEIMELSSGNMH